MAQHDYVIANGTGAAVRSDLNDAFAAIVSQNSGTTEPATTYAYQFWADTSAGVLKLRNAANNAWITLRELDGTLTMEDGAVSAPGLAFASDLNTGIFTGGADQFNIATNGVERVEFGTSEVVFNDGGANYDFRIEGDTEANLFFVDASADAVGLGTSSPSERLDVNGNINFTSSSIVGSTTVNISTDTTQAFYYGLKRIGEDTRFNGMKVYNNANGASGQPASRIGFFTDRTGVAASTERLTITEDGEVGIGTTSVQAKFHVSNAGAEGVEIEPGGISGANLTRHYNRSTSAYINNNIYALNSIFHAGASEVGRWDSSGRLLVGTSSTSIVSTAVFQGSSGGAEPGIIRITSTSSSPADGADLGAIGFGDSGHGSAVSINAQREGGTWTSGSSQPTRLLFYTTADGSASPTERMRISADGSVLIGATNPVSTSYLYCRANGSVVAYFDRKTDDGPIIIFRQDNVDEGSIAVSGTTVSYNGAHLSRWSQLPGNAERTEILRGTVLSNIDEMCVWGEEENEQLNRMKVSDVEGDPNVAGVFQAWDDDDDTYTDDFYCAMTGDFIIRIAEGVTVQRGDLLMSAGDGTAKPQDDDIIRSKTVAKVTSTHVTCTYDDGSYCVPCVLMAC